MEETSATLFAFGIPSAPVLPRPRFDLSVPLGLCHFSFQQHQQGVLKMEWKYTRCCHLDITRYPQHHQDFKKALCAGLQTKAIVETSHP